MQYLLSQSEYDSLTPVKRLQERNEALEVSCSLIVPIGLCNRISCGDCPIGQLENQEIINLICIRPKHYSK